MLKIKLTKIWDLFFGRKLHKHSRRRWHNALRFEPLEHRHMLTVVTAVTPTDTGFVAQFDQPIDPASIVLAGDVTLNGLNSGDIPGTVALSSDLTQLTFIANCGTLAPDTYSASLSDSIYDADGNALDGDADGTPGGIFTNSFTATGDGGGGDSSGSGDSGDGGNNMPTPQVPDADFDAFEHVASMTITLSARATTAMTYNYRTIDGSANSQANQGLNIDYDYAAGSMTIPVGEQTATVSINIHSDSSFDAPRSFTLQLLDPTTGLVVADGTGTIHDVQFSIDLVTDVSESDGFATLCVTPSNPTYESLVTVNFQDREGSATRSTDYGAATNSLQWNVGDAAPQSIQVAIVNDSIFESTENFFIDLSTPKYADANQSSAFLDNAASTGEVDIHDDDDMPMASITPAASANEGNAIIFTVSLSGQSSMPISIDYATADYSTVAGADYLADSGTLVFSPGETTKTISITTLNDHAVLGDKDFFVNLSQAPNTNLSTDASSGTGTVLDNPAPSAVDDEYSVQQGQTISITAGAGLLGNDSDAQNAALSAILASGPSYGTLTLNGDGSFTYTADASFVGTDTFTYRANNGNDDSNLATVSIDVSAVAAPSVQDHAYNINQYDTLNASDLLDGASDPNGYSLSVVAASGSTGNGSFDVNTDGSFSYAPAGSFSGTDSFSFMVTNGWASTTATVTIYVQALPVPSATDQSFEIQQNSSLTSTLPGVDTGLWVAANSAPTSNGWCSVNTDGSFSYAPTTGFTGTDEFSFTITNGHDSSTANVTITVDPLAAPTAQDHAYNINQYDPLNGSDLLDGASDPNGYSLSVMPGGGSTGNGSYNINTDGSFSYSPAGSFSGTDSFGFTVTNGWTSSSATVTVYVQALPVPSATNQSFEIQQNSSLTGTLPGADTGLWVAANSGSTSYGSFNIGSDGSFTYAPNSGFAGTDSFTYAVTNGHDSSTATVTIVVDPFAAPLAQDQSFTMNQYDTLSGSGLLDGASDPNGLSFWVVAGSGSTSSGYFSVNADGSFSYAPSGNFSGTDSFGFTVTNGWTSSSATVTVYVQALPVPCATNQSFEIQENSSLTGTLSGADTGLWVAENSGSTSYGSFNIGSDGSFTYAPNSGFAGTDSFIYAVTNGHDSSTATVTIVVDPFAAPLAQDQSFTINQYDTLSGGGLLGGASDPNGLSFWVVAGSGSTGSGYFSVNTDGSFSYTPSGNFSGTDSFGFTITNGWTSSSATASVVVLALPVPMATCQSNDVAENSGLGGTLPGAGAGLWVIADSGSTGNGSFSIAEDGSFSYSPNTDYVGSDSFGYTVTNGHDTTWASVTMNVYAA